MASHPVCDNVHKHSIGGAFDILYEKIRAPEEHPCAICQARRPDLSEKQKRHIARKIAFSFVYGTLGSKPLKMLSIGVGDDNPPEKRPAEEQELERKGSSKKGKLEPLDDYGRIRELHKQMGLYVPEYEPSQMVEQIDPNVPPLPPLELVPMDILRQIVGFISDPRSILNFGFTSQSHYAITHSDFMRRRLFYLSVEETFHTEYPYPITLNELRNFLKTMALLNIKPDDGELFTEALIELNRVCKVYGKRMQIKNQKLPSVTNEIYLNVALQLTPGMAEEINEKDEKWLISSEWKTAGDYGVYAVSWPEACVLAHNILLYDDIRRILGARIFYGWIAQSSMVIHNFGFYEFIISIMPMHFLDNEFFTRIWKDMTTNYKPMLKHTIPIEKIIRFYFHTGNYSFFVSILEWMPLNPWLKYDLNESAYSGRAIQSIEREVLEARNKYTKIDVRISIMTKRLNVIKEKITIRESEYTKKYGKKLPPTQSPAATRGRDDGIEKYHKFLENPNAMPWRDV